MTEKEESFLDQYKFVRRALILFLSFVFIVLTIVYCDGYIRNGTTDTGFTVLISWYYGTYFTYISVYTYARNILNKRMNKDKTVKVDDDYASGDA
jgi:hypothetical protein